jgi:cation:H+ antiporter
MEHLTFPVWQAVVLLVLGFYLLAKSSNWLVDAAVGIAERFNVPKLLIGIVLVGMATTAPEFAVSVLSALQGKAEMALGNAVGSVIVDDGVALACVALFATAPVLVSGRVLKNAAFFLVLVDIVCFVLVALDGTLSRGEGFVLLGIFFAYLGYSIYDRKRCPEADAEANLELEEAHENTAKKGMPALVGMFLVGLAVIIGSSEVVVLGAVSIAEAAGIPDVVVALTIVAIGTSLPEIATCVTAARKGHGSLAVGDIIGADILNIAWIAGASAAVNPLTVKPEVIFFMFPSMLVIVFTMLGWLIIRKKMTRTLGYVLVAEYVIYMTLMGVFVAMGVFSV